MPRAFAPKSEASYVVKGALAMWRFLPYRHAREFLTWFLSETLRAPTGGMEARALLGLCDRYFLLTHVLGRSDMVWHGDLGESIPAGNVGLYERCREVEGVPRPA